MSLPAEQSFARARAARRLQRRLRLPQLRLFLRGRRVGTHLLIGGALIGLLLLAALLAPLLAPAPPDLMRPKLRLLPPGPGHIFGTDKFGRDLFSQVLFGARIAVGTAFPAVLLAALPGVGLGLLAGYYGGWWDNLCSRAMDAWMAFPGLLLAIVLVARLGPSQMTTVLALAIVGMPGYYRLARGGTLSARHMLHVEAAQALGLSDGRVLLRHILPQISSPLIVLLTLRLGTVLLAAGGLSYIGLGAQPPAPEWGVLLAAGRDTLDRAWWLAFFPGMAITGSVLGFNLLGDGLRDLLDVSGGWSRKEQ